MDISELIEETLGERLAGTPGGRCLMTEGCGCGCGGAPVEAGGCGATEGDGDSRKKRKRRGVVETSWSRREGDRKRGKGAGGNPAQFADHTPGGTARSRKHIKKRGSKHFGDPKPRRDREQGKHIQDDVSPASFSEAIDIFLDDWSDDRNPYYRKLLKLFQAYNGVAVGEDDDTMDTRRLIVANREGRLAESLGGKLQKVADDDGDAKRAALLRTRIMNKCKLPPSHKMKVQQVIRDVRAGKEPAPKLLKACKIDADHLREIKRMVANFL